MTEQVEALLTSDEVGEAELEELTRIHVTALSRDPWVPRLVAREGLARHTRVRELFTKRVGEGPMRTMPRRARPEHSP